MILKKSLFSSKNCASASNKALKRARKLLFPSKEEEFASGKELVKQEISKVGGSVVNENDMGDRELAYPVKKQE